LGLYPALKEHKVRMTIISFYRIFLDFFWGTHMEGTNNATRHVMVWEASMGQTNKYKLPSLI
jgi:hypothetical protein